MLDLKPQEQNPKLLSPLTLAFLGDAVYELCVRQRVVAEGNRPVNGMHREAVKLVNAAAQSDAFERISGALTEEELAVYKRGRNAHVHQVPKNATYAQYARATGLECLFGALYLTGQLDRLNELFILTMEESHAI